MEGTSQFYQCTCCDQFKPFTHSWYGREPTVQQDNHLWSENTTKPREESREENFTDSSDTGRCGNADGRPSIDWDVFMPWSSIADPEDLKRLSEHPAAAPTKWDRYIDEQLSPYASCAEEEGEADWPRRLRPRTAPVRLRAGGPLAKTPTPSAPGRCSTQLPCSTESGTCPKKAEGRHSPGSAQSTPAGRTQAVHQGVGAGASAGAGAGAGGRQGASGRRRLRLEEEASESGPFSPCGLLPEDQLYSEAVRRELRRLMGPEEAPSGVPAPSQPPPPSPAPSLPSFPSAADAPLSATSPAPSPAPSPTRALAPAAARASSARAESAGSGAGAEAGSWPRAALSTRWLNDHLCAKRCSQPCPPRRGREDRQAEAGALGAAGLRRARAEAAARLREAVAAAERAARHQAAAGADPQLAEAAAAAAARDYRTFVVGHVHGELPPSATRIASGGRKGGDASAGGAALGAGGEPAVRIVGYVGVTRPATPPATPTPQRLQQQQQRAAAAAAATGEARRRPRP